MLERIKNFFRSEKEPETEVRTYSRTECWFMEKQEAIKNEMSELAKIGVKETYFTSLDMEVMPGIELDYRELERLVPNGKYICFGKSPDLILDLTKEVL